jgi:hypothetical protein
MKQKKLNSLIILIILIFLSSNLGFSQWDILSNNFVRKIQITNYDTAFADVDNNGIMKTTDNALTWSNVLPNSVVDFSFKNSYIGVAIRNDSIYRTMDGGASWQFSADPNTTPDVKKVMYSGENDVFFYYAANLYWSGNPSANTLFKTVDAGILWNQITLPSDIIGSDVLYLQSMIALDELNLFLYYRASPSDVLYELKSSDGGINWEPYVISPHVDFIVNNTTKYGHYNNFFLRTTDSGVTWDSIQVSIGNNNIVEVDFINENFGALVCRTFFDSTEWVYRTCDGGVTWNADTIVLQNSSFMFGPIDLDLYAYNYGFISAIRMDTSIFNLLILDNVIPDSTDCSYIPPNTSGLNSLPTDSKIEIFPNPSRGLLNINLTGSGEISIQITNIKGQLVYENNRFNHSGWVQLDLDLMQGLYIIMVEENINLITKKLVIK